MPPPRGERIPLPVFRVAAEGRLIARAAGAAARRPCRALRLRGPCRRALTGPDRRWPQSTRQISELRLRLDFERRDGFRPGPSQFTIDIVDYPGEWLLDLPLLEKSYAEWSRETFDASAAAARAPLAAEWRGFSARPRSRRAGGRGLARQAADVFTAYLRAARGDSYALSTLPPGRFLMPGDLEGSPALTFAPLPLPDGGEIAPGTLAAMMERRYEAYKTHVVRPFFRDHFARLDRQIVLVDALAALNSGPAALRDLQTRAQRGARGVPDRARQCADQPVPAEDRQDPGRRDQGRPSAPPQPRPAGGDFAAIDGARHCPAPNFPARRWT